MLVSHLIQFLAGIHQFQLPQHREKTPLYYTGRRTYPLYLEMCLNLNCKSGVKIGGESRRQTSIQSITECMLVFLLFIRIAISKDSKEKHGKQVL